MQQILHPHLNCFQEERNDIDPTKAVCLLRAQRSCTPRSTEVRKGSMKHVMQVGVQPTGSDPPVCLLRNWKEQGRAHNVNGTPIIFSYRGRSCCASGFQQSDHTPGQRKRSEAVRVTKTGRETAVPPSWAYPPALSSASWTQSYLPRVGNDWLRTFTAWPIAPTPSSFGKERTKVMKNFRLVRSTEQLPPYFCHS